MTGDVAIYGASGTVGSLLVARLVGGGATVRLLGRDGARLDALEAAGAARHVAARGDRAALARALTGAAVVVDASSAALDDDVEDPLVAAALAAGAHYLDLRGEPAALRSLHERHEASARHAGLVVCGGVGFDVAVGDWAAALAARALEPGQVSRADGADTHGRAAAEPPPLDELVIATAYDELAVTPGSQRSLAELTARPGWRWDDDRWVAQTLGAEQRSLDFGTALGGLRPALTWPGGEVITTPRHVTAKRIVTLASLTHTVATAGVARVLARLMAPLARAGFGSSGGRGGTGMVLALPGDAAARARARFAVVAEARRAAGTARVRIVGTDPSAVTVTVAAWAARQLVEHGPARSGVLAPSELWEPAAALAACGLDAERS